MARELHLRPLRYPGILVGAVVLMCFLTPTLLCAIPGAPMSGADCCEHMTSEECRTANMSACCETTTPGVALAALTKAANELSAPMINTLHWSVYPPELRTIAFRVSVYDASPPGLESIGSSLILRI
jgi:hypothetical protein